MILYIKIKDCLESLTWFWGPKRNVLVLQVWEKADTFECHASSFWVKKLDLLMNKKYFVIFSSLMWLSKCDIVKIVVEME